MAVCPAGGASSGWAPCDGSPFSSGCADHVSLPETAVIGTDRRVSLLFRRSRGCWISGTGIAHPPTHSAASEEGLPPIFTCHCPLLLEQPHLLGHDLSPELALTFDPEPRLALTFDPVAPQSLRRQAWRKRPQCLVSLEVNRLVSPPDTLFSSLLGLCVYCSLCLEDLFFLLSLKFPDGILPILHDSALKPPLSGSLP